MSNDPQNSLRLRCRARTKRRRILGHGREGRVAVGHRRRVACRRGRVPPTDQRVTAPGLGWRSWPAASSSPKGRPATPTGNVFFTDQPNDRILKWSVDGKLSTFMQPCGRSNGLCFDRQGQPLGLRRREERAVAHRPGGQGRRSS